ncbi:MAG: HAD-IIIA family hydrolase [Opitutaceae bacterium]
MSTFPVKAQTSPSDGGAVRPAGLFLDRDGTVIVHVPYLHDPDAVVLVPGAARALSAARQAGFRLYLFTNQSGVGRGLFDLAAVHAVNRRMIELLGLGDDVFASQCIAPEAPDQPAVYRKPSPRFILETGQVDGLDLSRSWMIGDSLSDWEAGLNAGIRSAAVDVTPSESTEQRRKRETLGVPGFADLPAAVEFIVRASA